MVNENELIVINDNPSIKENSQIVVDEICDSLSIPRSILPDNESIEYALMNLNREIKKIPLRLKNKEIVKLYVAVSVGLYDDGIVRVWNLVIYELRNKINLYGIEMIRQVANDNYDDNYLKNIKDSDLLILARQLNIITEQGYYLLDQCRDIRNNASIAHYSEIELSDSDMMSFINRCVTYGLQEDYATKGIDLKMLISMLENEDTTKDQIDSMVHQISNTFESQKELIWQILYGKVTNPETLIASRNNSVSMSQALATVDGVPEIVEADMIEKYYNWQFTGKKKRVTLAQQFLEKINRINHLREPEKVALLNKAISSLRSTHLEMYNFYNEPAVAERLYELFRKMNPLPALVVNNMVHTVLQCYLGNAYGVSNAAEPYYAYILKNLSPKGMEVLLKLPEIDEDFSNQIFNNSNKKERYLLLLENINIDSLSALQKASYDGILKKLKS